MSTYSYPEKFESIGGNISYAFSLHQLEAQFEQALRVPIGIGVGADYAHDHLGYGVSPKDPGSIRIRAMSVEDTPRSLQHWWTRATGSPWWAAIRPVAAASRL